MLPTTKTEKITSLLGDFNAQILKEQLYGANSSIFMPSKVIRVTDLKG